MHNVGRVVAAAALVLVASGCTKQERAKSFGGTVTSNLPSCKKLVNATWKEADLWLLVRDMKPGEQPELYQLVEDSSFGIWEGIVNIQEIACSAEAGGI